jgi:hypothetical protein
MRMRYAIALVTDATPASLGYGDYRGLVILDDDIGQTLADGDGWAHPADIGSARAWIAAQEETDPGRVRITADPGPDNYQQVWTVTIADL